MIARKVSSIAALLMLMVGCGTEASKDNASSKLTASELCRASFTQEAYDQALEHCLQAADYGDANAQFNLGLMHRWGFGVTQDLMKAVHWFQSASDQDHPDAQYNLAWRYSIGDELKRDYGEALRLFHAAADNGHADAQYRLYWVYAWGARQFGIATDFTEAALWAEHSARQGNTLAQKTIGTLFELGHGVDRDYVTAQKWFIISATNGYPEAEIARDALASRMAPEQVAKAQEIALRCMITDYQNCE